MKASLIPSLEASARLPWPPGGVSCPCTGGWLKAEAGPGLPCPLSVRLRGLQEYSQSVTLLGSGEVRSRELPRGLVAGRRGRLLGRARVESGQCVGVVSRAETLWAASCCSSACSCWASEVRGSRQTAFSCGTATRFLWRWVQPGHYRAWQDARGWPLGTEPIGV